MRYSLGQWWNFVCLGRVRRDTFDDIGDAFKEAGDSVKDAVGLNDDNMMDTIKDYDVSEACLCM